MLTRAKYKRITHKTAQALKKSATEILYEKMIFYNRRAIKLYADIRKKLKEDSDKGEPTRGDIMAQMVKYMNAANDVCIECAAKLAPYQSPKLQSMEVNKKVTHRFVIQAPKQVEDSASWLAQSQAPMKLLNGTAHTLEESPNADQQTP